MSERPIRVLFVCTGNSARSQIAEALLTDIGGDDFAAFSAGTEPKGINPFTIEALAHVGIDWSAARSKSVHGVPGSALRLRHHGLRPGASVLPGVPWRA